jgi:hypothetical protein
MYVWMDGWMGASLTLEYLGGFFQSLAILDRCPVNFNIPAPKVGAFKLAIFSKRTLNNFD